MTLETIKSLGNGGGFLNDKLPRILTELQQLTISGPLTGAAANTAITVPEGIDIQDTVVKALQFASGVPSDITSTISIVDSRATGTITLTAGLAATNVVNVNGKAYTAVDVVPSYTSTGVGPQQFLAGAAIAALSTTLAKVTALQAAGFSAAVSATLAAGGALYIAAASLAQAIAATDGLLTTSYSGAVTTIIYRAETAAGNSVALSVASSGGHATASASTLLSGQFGLYNGTITCTSIAVGDTVTVDGVTFTAVASGTPLSPLTFIGGTVAAADLLAIGINPASAAAVIAVSNDAAVATILAQQIDSYDGAKVVANNNLPKLSTGQENDLFTVAVASGASNIINVAGTVEGYNPGTISQTGGHFAVAGETAPARGIKSTSVTTGNTVVLFWFKKSRVVGQA